MNVWNLLARKKQTSEYWATSTPSPKEIRDKILRTQGRFFAETTLRVLAQADLQAQVKQWYVASRYIGIGVRLADATKLVRAITLADAIGYAAGVGDGSPEPPVMAMPLGFLLYFQFQLPEKVNVNDTEIKLWRDIFIDDPRLVGGGLGVGPRGTIIKYNWDVAPHTLVAGMTNSGKSTLNQSILYTLMKSHTPQALQILIIDPNHDYTMFESEQHLLGPIAHSPDDITKALRYFAHRTDERSQVNNKEGTRLLLLVDEADKPYVLGQEENLANVKRVVREGRAFRCNVLVSTHKPDAAALGPIREELDNRFLGKVATAQISGQLGAGLDLHKLTSRGDFKHTVLGRSLRFQAAITSSLRLEHLERGEITPLPDLEPLESQEPEAKKGRPVTDLQPEAVAYYLYYGVDQVTEADALKKLGIKRRAHEIHRDFSKKVAERYKILQEGGQKKG